MKTYKAGIIGLGFIGVGDQVSGDAIGQRVEDLGGTHMEALSGNPQVTLVAGSSRDQGRRDRFEQRTGLRSYADWRDLIEKEDLDIVSIAANANLRKDPTVVCAKTGVSAIYCEKPAAQSVPDAEEMLLECRNSGTLILFNHQRRFSSSGRRLREHLKHDRLGDLTSVNAQWNSGRLGGVGTHVFDTIRMITGRPIQAVSGTLDLAGKPDCRGPDYSDYGAWGIVRLEGGLMVTVDAADYSQTPWDLRINGTEGRAFVGGNEVVIEYWDGRTERWINDIQQGSGMDVAVREIVDWLDNGKVPEYDPAEAVNVVEGIVAFHASNNKNSMWVELPLVGTDRAIKVNCA